MSHVRQNHKWVFGFFDASLHHYIWLCPSVRMSICPYVHLSVCPSVHPSVRQHLSKTAENDDFSLRDASYWPTGLVLVFSRFVTSLGQPHGAPPPQNTCSRNIIGKVIPMAQSIPVYFQICNGWFAHYKLLYLGNDQLGERGGWHGSSSSAPTSLRL